jgi:hypothetical protein
MPTIALPSPPPIDGVAATPSLRTLGIGAQQAAPGDDARFGTPSNAVITPAANKIPLADGTGKISAGWLNLNQDMIAAGFTISSFVVSVTVLEIGASTTDPSFTASYNRVATAVTLNDGSGALSVTLPATSFAYNAGGLPTKTYTSNTINATQSFTLSANELGGPVKTASASIAWRPRVYYGVATDPGTYNEAFVEGLTSNALASGRQRSLSLNSSGAQYMYYAFPATFGGSSSNFIDASTGFAAGWSLVATVSVTAGTAGVPTNSYSVWRADVAGLGAQTITVT